MITKRAMKTNRGAGRHHNYLIFRHVSTFNDHLMFSLVGSPWCRTLPRLIEKLPDTFLNVGSKAGWNWNKTVFVTSDWCDGLYLILIPPSRGPKFLLREQLITERNLSRNYHSLSLPGIKRSRMAILHLFDNSELHVCHGKPHYCLIVCSLVHCKWSES